MIKLEPPAEFRAWYEDHPQFACPSDLLLVASSALAPVVSLTVLPPGEAGLEAVERKERLERARSLRSEWALTWLGRRRESTTLLYSIHAVYG